MLVVAEVLKPHSEAALLLVAAAIAGDEARLLEEGLEAVVEDALIDVAARELGVRQRLDRPGDPEVVRARGAHQ